MSGRIQEYFKSLKEHKKIGHAYLICNCDLSTIEDELNKSFSECFFDKEIDIRNNEDILIIEPDNNSIKKDEILKIQENVKKTSQLSDIKIYIINQCEKMNEFASNSLLKLLEEPEKGIYAFLITNNIDSVLKTIYSRCQVLKFYNDDSSNLMIENLDEEQITDVIKFVSLLNKYGNRSIAHYSFISKKVKDRDVLRIFFTLLLFIYRDALNIKLEKNLQYLSDKKNKITDIANLYSIDELISILGILTKYLTYVDMNLNTNLLIDRFIIEVVGDEE